MCRCFLLDNVGGQCVRNVCDERTFVNMSKCMSTMSVQKFRMSNNILSPQKNYMIMIPTHVVLNFIIRLSFVLLVLKARYRYLNIFQYLQLPGNLMRRPLRLGGAPRIVEKRTRQRRRDCPSPTFVKNSKSL